jgi:hypothetical protein
MKVVLDIIKGPHKGASFSFREPDVFLVGRSKDAHFQLTDDPYISRRHFYLEISPPNCLLKDLGSTNCTKVNDLIVAEQLLRNGDIIEAGFTQIKVLIDLHIEKRSAKCKKCGDEIVLIENESAPEYCERCEQEIKKAALSTHKAEGITASCWKCGVDLTRYANSDGRLSELKDVVTHSCKSCLPPHDPEEKRRLGHYEIVRKLGAGGMGKVFLAYHPKTGRLVAIKQMIRLDVEALASRFKREIRIAEGIAHTNVIRVIDRGSDREGPYLVTEFASGGNLADLIKTRRGPLPPVEAVGYISQTLRGLDHIHRKRIIHRDIKPENILLHQTNGKIIAKLSDFGLAKEYLKAGGTIVNRHLGTLMFSAPEQIMNARDVREPADIYSMGVTLYYLLTAELPYRFPSELEILQFRLGNPNRFNNTGEALKMLMGLHKMQNPANIILSDDPIPVRERNPDIPPSLAAVVDKAIRKEASARHGSAGEFLNALERVSLK